MASEQIKDISIVGPPETKKRRPRCAILMLSWLRFEVLLSTLEQVPKTCSLPLHLILRVQGMEHLTDEDRQRVHQAAKGFATTDIYFTRDNVGSAAARLDLTHRGAKQGYDYMMFTDDDIDFPSEGIEHQISVLDRHPEVGSVSLKPGGIRKVQLVSKDGVVQLTTWEGVDEKVVEVYLVGSASIMFRTILYTKYLVAPDPAYYIGTWDWDFVLQIRKAGYKVCVITDKQIINKRGGCQVYRKKRRNKRYVIENRRLFIEKWGFDPVKSRRINSDFVKPINPENRIERKKLLKELAKESIPVIVERIPKKSLKKRSITGTDWRSRIHDERRRQAV